ncbi:MAG: GNAT family N-acetyltransferase [Saprospiraceae bacterium]|nr:GNAT family N-acetyltransferase [Saprospiraceae bacterium]
METVVIKPGPWKAFSCSVYTSIKECGDQIDQLQVPSILLRSAYLQAIESSLSKDMGFRYLLFFSGSQIIGFSYCQIYPFNAKKSFKVYREKHNNGSGIKSVLAKWVNFKALVSGNLLLTGQYGYYFDPEYRINALDVLQNSWQQLFEKEAKEDCEVSVMFAKDFDANLLGQELDYLTDHNYFKFSVQPSMGLEITGDWRTIEDYLNALKSKYRIRLNQALRKSEDLRSCTLGLSELLERREEMQHLLDQILEESDFRIVNFNIRYIIEVKKTLDELFEIRGHFIGDTLVGFMTYFRDSDRVLAHFTGFNVSLNKRLDLYLNMLLDLIGESIKFKGEIKYLDFSRTALEIKSSVGATPRPMINFLKHRNRTMNKVLPNIFNALYQQEEWIQRRPFKS